MYAEHQQFLTERQNVLLEELRVIGEQDFEKAKEEYGKACQAWDEKQKKKLEVGSMDVVSNITHHYIWSIEITHQDGPSRAGSPSANISLSAPANAVAETSDAGNGPTPKAREREEKPPQQKYKWTDDLKARVWGLVHLSNESCRIQNAMAYVSPTLMVVMRIAYSSYRSWEPEKVTTITEQGARKGLYAKVSYTSHFLAPYALIEIVS